MSVQVSANIDEATKQKFERICSTVGVSSSSALNMFIKRVIAYNDIPFSLISPEKQKSKMSREDVFGCMRGQFKMASDFNAPLDDFKEYME